jgi:hypothetical protein
MPFFLSTVITALFFLGRSIGLSPICEAACPRMGVSFRTSTIIADHSLSADESAFLPGKLNFLDLINWSSTR